MGVITGREHDVAATMEELQKWFAVKWPRATDIEIIDAETYPDNGISSETIGFFLLWKEHGKKAKDKFILRLPPSGGRGVFAEYDFGKQARVQKALAGAGLPVVAPVGAETDTKWLGTAFMVMKFVEGRIPGVEFPMAGWVIELSPSERSCLMRNFIDGLAAVHAADWRGLGLESVCRYGGPGLEPEWRWWQTYRTWAELDGDRAENKLVADLFRWCQENRPTSEPPSSLVWGDPRIGNVIFGDDLEIRAVLDWETVTVAPAETDLGWHYSFTRNMCAFAGIAQLAELDGFPSEEEELRQWEARLGRSVQDLDWHIMFGSARIAACTLAVRRAARIADKPEFLQYGLIPEWVLARM